MLGSVKRIYFGNGVIRNWTAEVAYQQNPRAQTLEKISSDGSSLSFV